MSPVHLGQLLAIAGLVAVAALAVERPAVRLGLPAPVAFLAFGLALGALWPDTRRAAAPGALSTIGTIALVVILLGGGFATGLAAIRRLLGPVLALGAGGTLLTFALVAVVAHALCGLGWDAALIVGAALSPTDPAAVFSVLGPARRRLGRVVVLLEGEAGFNDPIAIALTVALVAGASGGGIAVSAVARKMLVEGVVGAVAGLGVGFLMARALGPRWPTLRVAPALAVLAGGFVSFGLGAAAHGSGFLAVYLYGLLIGDDADLPERELVGAFLGELSSLAEIGMFTLLGLGLGRVALGPSIGNASILAVALLLVVRPLVAVAPLRALGLSSGEAAFAAIAGLKGAVPILLAALPLAAGVADGSRIFAIAGLVVLITLPLQGVAVRHSAGNDVGAAG